MNRTYRVSLSLVLALALVFAVPAPRAKALGILQAAIALVVVAVVGTGVYVAVKAGKALDDIQRDRMTNCMDMNFEYNDMDGTGWQPLTNVNDRPDEFVLLISEVPPDSVEWPLLAQHGIEDGPHTHVVQLPPSPNRIFRVTK